MNNKLETRTALVQVRASEDFVLEGIAAAYGTTANIGGAYMETIAPGAFTKSLRDGADVRCLINHDPNRIVGRTKSGTLTLKDTAKGLAFRCQLDRSNTQHADVYAQVKRGDLDACSFAFTVPEGGDTWTETKDARGQRMPLRTLRSVRLLDVSVVTYPAYPDGTNVGARANNNTGDDVRRARCDAQGQKIDADNRARAAVLGAQIKGA